MAISVSFPSQLSPSRSFNRTWLYRATIKHRGLSDRGGPVRGARSYPTVSYRTRCGRSIFSLRVMRAHTTPFYRADPDGGRWLKVRPQDRTYYRSILPVDTRREFTRTAHGRHKTLDHLFSRSRRRYRVRRIFFRDDNRPLALD